MNLVTPASPIRERRWFQYSLRTLALVMLILGLGLTHQRTRRMETFAQQNAAQEIEEAGGTARRDYDDGPA